VIIRFPRADRARAASAARAPARQQFLHPHPQNGAIPMRIDDATACRLAIIHNGYTPIPLFGKAPPQFGKNNAQRGLAGWQHLANVTSSQVHMWARVWPDALNTGILTGPTPALDLDLLNELAAIDAEELVRERFEAHGRVLVRIGKAPKRAIPFRTDEPFAKITAALTRPGFESLGEKLELLADRQQLVVHGIHPGTGRPYAWFGGTPWTVAHDELPLIDAKQAGQLVSDIVDLLTKEYGYTAARISSRGLSTHPEGSPDWNVLVANIISGADLHKPIRNLACKLIRSGMHPGAAVHMLRALMRASSVPHDDRWRERYDDIPRQVFGATRLVDTQAIAD
jgi:hypothetical protein